MNDPVLPLPGLSPVCGKRVEVKFDSGFLSSDGGVLVLRGVRKSASPLIAAKATLALKPGVRLRRARLVIFAPICGDNLAALRA